MNRISLMLLNIAAALYLFANGIWGVQKGGDFATMITSIGMKGDIAGILIIVLGVCGIAAAVFMMLALFKIEVPITDLILLVFIVLWVIFIVIVDILRLFGGVGDVLSYLATVATHLMVLGALAMSTKRFGRF